MSWFEDVVKLVVKIQVILDREHEIAKAHLATGQKDRAVIALRRRKYQQGLLVKTDGQLENLEQLVRRITSPILVIPTNLL